MDSLGYFGKWFPTEHKKYTAIIAMMYLGVVTTVLGVLFELALRGLEMIGLFGGPVGIRRTIDVLTFFSGLNALASLALFVIMIYLLYKTRALVYLLKMALVGSLTVLLLVLIARVQRQREQRLATENGGQVRLLLRAAASFHQQTSA